MPVTESSGTGPHRFNESKRPDLGNHHNGVRLN
ncbi:hypothetical protein ABIE18_004313 [Arthrobacter sp. 2762]